MGWLSQVYTALGEQDFVYFILDIAIVFGLVSVVVSLNEKNRWKLYRQNMVQNLYERFDELLSIYSESLQYVQPLRVDDDIIGSVRDRPHYQQDSGTALRAFQYRLRNKRNEIRQSMELGLVAISSELAGAISEFQADLDLVVDLTTLVIQLDRASELPKPGELSIKRFARQIDRGLTPGSVRLQKGGGALSYSGPLTRLRLHLLNLAISVECASKIKNVTESSPLDPVKSTAFAEDRWGAYYICMPDTQSRSGATLDAFEDYQLLCELADDLDAKLLHVLEHARENMV